MATAFFGGAFFGGEFFSVSAVVQTQTPAGKSKRRRFTIWEEDPEESVEEAKPVVMAPEKVLRAVIKARKSGEKALQAMRFAVDDGPKLDLAGFLEEMRARDILYAARMEAALLKLRVEEDEADIAAIFALLNKHLDEEEAELVSVLKYLH